jgi:hypothetical protein
MRSHSDLDHEIESLERRIRERKHKLRDEVERLKDAAREAGSELRANAMKPALVAVALVAGYVVARRRRHRIAPRVVGIVDKAPRPAPRSKWTEVAAAAFSTLAPHLISTAQSAAVNWLSRRAHRQPRYRAAGEGRY